MGGPYFKFKEYQFIGCSLNMYVRQYIVSPFKKEKKCSKVILRNIFNQNLYEENVKMRPQENGGLG